MLGVGRKARLTRQWRAALPDHVIALAWSPDNKHIAAAAVKGPVALLDAATGAVQHLLPGHGFGATSLAWLDDGTVASAGQDGRVRLWDAASGAENLSLDAGAKWVERVTVSPYGTWIASAAGRKVRLWGRDGKLLRDWPEHASTVTDIVWKPGGKELTSSAYGGVRLWSPAVDAPVREFSWKGSVLRLAWSPDGKYLATGDQDSTVHFWIAATGQDLHMFGYPMKVRELAWDRGSRFLATGGGPVVTVWDCSGKGPEGTTPLQLEGHDEEATMNALAFQKAGPLLASGGGDGKLVLWQPEKGNRPLAESRLDAGVTQVAWSGDDARLAVGTDSGEVVVHDT
ncbi:MAG: WD40 repeat domain-containing protein [Planctomycetes bacterium]|nr:WD40 repeat domain-containing protein [Planctomycetota bacterium]